MTQANVGRVGLNPNPSRTLHSYGGLPANPGHVYIARAGLTLEAMAIGGASVLKKYFDDLTSDLERESSRIREFFATHNPSAGANREGLVANLLGSHILPAVGISTGLVLSSSGELSQQADVVLFDATSNGPLHGSRPIPLWLMEAVYAVMEVKTQLTPTTLKESVAKCRRFKKLPKNFADSHGRQKIADSLFIIWSFEAPADLALAKKNFEAATKGVPESEQPDFVVVPGRFLLRGGHYFDISNNGQVGSSYRAQRLAAAGGDPTKLVDPPFEMLDLGSNTLVAFVYWLNSWLYAAGPRRPDLVSYYQISSWGKLV